MATRIPQIGTPYEDPNKAENAGTFNKPWFLWFQQVDAAIQTLPPAPQPPPPPAQANIQFQDDGVNLGTANPPFVSFDAGLVGTRIADTVHIAGANIEFQTNGVDLGTPNPTTVNFRNNLTTTRAVDTIIVDAASSTSGIAPFAGQILEWLPTNNGGEANASLRITGANGTQSDETEGEGTAIDAILKLNYAQAVVASGQGPWFSGCNIRRGSVSGSGGFIFYAIWGTRATFSADTSGGFGLFSTITWAGFDPSGNNIDQFCLGADAADTNWQWIRRTAGAGAVTKVDLGVAKGTQQMFYITISCATGVGSMNVRVVQVTGYGTQSVLLDTNYSTNLPVNSTALIPMWFFRSATTLSTSWLGYMKIIRPLNPAFS